MGTFLRVITIIGVGAMILLFLKTQGCFKKEPTHTVSPSPTPTPIPILPRKAYETARLFNGITLKSSVEATSSLESSLHLEKHPESYTLGLELHLSVPSAATTSTNLLAATPELAELLPDFEALLTNASVSSDFATLFANKEKNLRSNLNTLQRLLPLDTLYDCQTILNLQNTKTERRALLIQALMNVNSDGADGDRNLEPDAHSAFFQPQTNYRWPKLSARPNPCLPEIEHRLAVIQQKLADIKTSTNASTSAVEEENSRLLSALADTKATLEELKHWSFLVGNADPFIVLPSFMITGAEGHPTIGDYAIVIANGTLYPAILGDKGPNYKIGEASLRICKEINDDSTAEIRPIDHPTVTYLIFPGSAEKPFSTPDYAHWSERCHALWKEFGGSDAATWQEWESLEKPWPTPTPSPTPSPDPTPSVEPQFSTSASNSLSPDGTNSPSPIPSLTPDASSGTNPASFPSPTNSAALTPTPTNSPQ